jgi:hypothetical protein
MNDRGIAQYVAKEDWVRKKDWPVNVDKRNKNKKYTTYREEEIAGMLQVANDAEEALRMPVHGWMRAGWGGVVERRHLLGIRNCTLLTAWIKPCPEHLVRRIELVR